MLTQTTLLEYVVQRFLGPPLYRASPPKTGESYWPCPACGGSKFHTLPHEPKFKDRYLCYNCDFRGDVFDFLKDVGGIRNFSDRIHKLDGFKVEFDRLCNDPESASVEETAAITVTLTHLHRHHRRSPRRPSLANNPPGEDRGGASRSFTLWQLSNAWAALTTTQRWHLVRAYETAEQAGMPMGEGLAKFCYDHERWKEAVLRHHYLDCDDGDCDWPICREARGIEPPMWIEWDEVKKYHRQKAEDRRRRAQRSQEFMRQAQARMEMLKAAREGA